MEQSRGKYNETFRPRGSLSVTNGLTKEDPQRKCLTVICLLPGDCSITYHFTSHAQYSDLSVEDTTGTQLAVLYTVKPLYRGHDWDPAGCPVYSGTSL